VAEWHQHPSHFLVALQRGNCQPLPRSSLRPEPIVGRAKRLDHERSKE
jgi:hypothetical protein